MATQSKATKAKFAIFFVAVLVGLLNLAPTFGTREVRSQTGPPLICPDGSPPVLIMDCDGEEYLGCQVCSSCPRE
jgi:hypothetical protein